MEYTSLRVVNKEGLISGNTTTVKIGRDVFINDATKGKTFTVSRREGISSSPSVISFNLLTGVTATVANKPVRVRLKYRLNYRGHETQHARDNVKFGQDDYVVAASIVGTPASATTLAADLVKKLNKGFNAGGNAQFEAYDNASATAGARLLSIKGKNKNIVIEEAYFEVYDKVSLAWNTIYTVLPTTPAVAGDVLYQVPQDEFGTSAWINENIRMITDHSVAPYVLHTDERPIDGKIYNQYTVTYFTERNDLSTGFPLGGVGKSKTVHVYYVEQDQVDSNEEWDTAVFDRVIGVTTEQIARA